MTGRTAPGVVLGGLPALYGHGLHDTLTAAGMSPVLVDDLEELSGALPRPGPVLVVVPADGLEPLQDLVEETGRTTEVSVVVVTPEDSVESFVAAVRGGALGVLHAGADLDLAVEVVRSAADGRVVVPERVARALSRPAHTEVAPRLEPREREWLRQLGEGCTVASLARSAAYSEREVYRLLSRTYHRLGASNRTDALLRAERWGLLDD